MSILAWFALGVLGAIVLGVWAWAASKSAARARANDLSPHADLPALEELRARRDRRFESGMDRTRGVKR